MLFRKPNKNNGAGSDIVVSRFVRLGFSSLVLFAMCAHAQSPEELIAQADQLAERSDWHDAGPLYARAEVAYRNAGDSKNEMYAKFGRLHRDLEDGSYRA